MTTPGGPYSAGTIFLQVVPSYRDFMRNLGRDAKDIEKALQGELEKGDGVGSPLDTPKSKAKRKASAQAAGKAEAEEYAGRFRDTMKKAMARTERELKALKVDVETEGVQKKIAALATRLETLKNVEIGVDLTSGEALQEMLALETALKSLAAQSVDVEVKTNITSAMRDIATLRRDIESLRDKKIEIEPEIRNTGSFVAKLQALAKTAAQALPDINIDADTSSADADIAMLKGRLLALSEMDIDVDLSADDALLELAALDARLALLQSDPDIRISADATAARMQVQAFLAWVNAQDAEIDVDVDKSASAHFESLSNNLRAFNGMILTAVAIGPLLVPILGALAGAAISAGAAFAGVGVGLGAMILGFSGIGSAVGAINDVQKNAAKDALASGKALRGASNGIRDAQRGLDRAYQSAADAAEMSSRRTQSALRAQRDAEKDLQRAQRDVQKTQDRLTKARREASEQLEDMALRARGGALAERQALIDLFEAEVAYRATMADPGATNLEKEQASVNLERERIGIESVRQSNAKLAAEQAENASKDIEQTDTVIAARESVEAANDRVVDAQERVADSNRGVAEARADAARSERDSMQSIEDAQLRLADAQVAYGEAMQQANEIGSASVQKLRDEMAQLGPAGQAFAYFIAGLEDEFFTLRNAVQEGMLPGVQKAIENLLPYMPQLTAFLGQMGTVLGEMFVAASETFTSPVWVEFFEMLAQYAPIFTTLFGETLLGLFTILAQLATAFAPLAKEMAEGLVTLLDGWSQYLASPEGQEMLERFMAYVRDAGPEVMQLLGALVRALVNLAVALAPYAGALVELFTAFLNWIADMDPDTLRLFVVGLIGLVLAFQVMAGLLGVIGSVVGVVGGLVVLFGSASAALAFAASVAGVALAVVAVLAVLVIAYFKIEWFRDFVNAAFAAVWEAVKLAFAGIKWAWDNILWPVLKAVWTAVTWLADLWMLKMEIIVKGWQWVWDQVQKLWDKFAGSGWGGAIIDFFQAVWKIIIDDAKRLWDDVAGLFKGGVRLVVSVINEGIVDPINWLAEKVGAKNRVDRIPMPFESTTAKGTQSTGMQEFATGGWTGPGEKMQVAGIVHADEFVVRKESQRAMSERFPGLLDYINREGTLPGYAQGGLVEFGRLLQQRGFRVGEHPLFGGVAPVHKGRGHYEGRAIDVNYGPGGKSKAEFDAINSIIGLAKSYGLSVIWQAPGHYGHAHFETGAKFDNIGNFAGARAAGATDVKQGMFGRIVDAIGNIISNPMKYVFEKLTNLPGIATLKESAIGQVMLGPVQQAMGWGIDWIKDKAGAVGDFFTGSSDDPPPTLYDQGGWLPPGLSTVINASGRPEPIFSAEQWEKIEQGGLGGSGDTINIDVDGEQNPGAVADAILFAKRHLDRGGKYAGAGAPS